MKKGKLVKELKKGKDMKKVKKGKIAHSGPRVDFPWRREAKPDLSEVARVFGADLGSLEAMPMGPWE